MNVKGHFLPFVAALAVCLAAFLALDMAIMNLQGLSLVFHQ